MSINHRALAKKINDELGEEVILRLYGVLSREEFDQLQFLMAEGKVGLHTDGHFGITIETDQGWTSEGF